MRDVLNIPTCVHVLHTHTDTPVADLNTTVPMYYVIDACVMCMSMCLCVDCMYIVHACVRARIHVCMYVHTYIGDI